MKRVLGAFIGALLVSALPAFAQADKPAAKADTAKSSAKTMTATGTVSAVTADSMTVKAKEGEMTFVVDGATKVEARGASHKTASMKDDKKPTMVTDFVKTGDTVTVKYHDMGDKKHAANVQVRSSAPAPAK
jgi:hypothetical protein